jgi:predicted GNAT family N-acyltransferase
MNIIKDAIDFLKEQGIDQWQNGYPNAEVIISDIKNGYGYVLVDNNNNIVATASVSFDGEPTYQKIYDGTWLSDHPYSVIHRIAVAKDVKGKSISSILIKQIEDLSKKNNIYSIKIDTHKENKRMQKVIASNQFQYCGIIYLEDKSERLAYEKILRC